jgi:hypothetical protein
MRACLVIRYVDRTVQIEASCRIFILPCEAKPSGGGGPCEAAQPPSMVEGALERSKREH